MVNNISGNISQVSVSGEQVSAENLRKSDKGKEPLKKNIKSVAEDTFKEYHIESSQKQIVSTFKNITHHIKEIEQHLKDKKDEINIDDSIADVLRDCEQLSEIVSDSPVQQKLDLIHKNINKLESSYLKLETKRQNLLKICGDLKQISSQQFKIANKEHSLAKSKQEASLLLNEFQNVNKKLYQRLDRELQKVSKPAELEAWKTNLEKIKIKQDILQLKKSEQEIQERIENNLDELNQEDDNKLLVMTFRTQLDDLFKQTKIWAETNDLSSLQDLRTKHQTILKGLSGFEERINIRRERPIIDQLVLNSFGSYVHKELKQEASEKLVNYLIEVGTANFPADIEDRINSITPNQQARLHLVTKYEKELHEAAPFLRDSSSSKEGGRVTVPSLPQKGMPIDPDHLLKDYKVKITKQNGDTWKAYIEHGKGRAKTRSEYPAGETKGVSYHEAAAWVHAQLDHKFYIESELAEELKEIAAALGLEPGVMKLIENVRDFTGRKAFGNIANASVFISQGIESFLKKTEEVAQGIDVAHKQTEEVEQGIDVVHKQTEEVGEGIKSAIEEVNKQLEMASAGCDVAAGLALILPSLLEFKKAHTMKKELIELNQKKQDYIKEAERQKQSFVIEYQRYAATYQMNEGIILPTMSDMRSYLKGELKRVQQEFPADVDRLEQIKNLINFAQEISHLNEEVKAVTKTMKTQQRALHAKFTNTANGFVSALATSAKAGIALHGLLHPGALSATAQTAALGLGAVAAPLLIGTGLGQLGFDSIAMHKTLHKKDDLKSIIKTLKTAENKGVQILSNNQIALLDDIKHMELRNINRQTVSTSMGITADVGLIAVGAVSLASIIVGATTLGVGVVAVPVVAGTALAGKMIYDAASKVVEDKEQRKLMENNPSLSDIGIIARLHETLRGYETNEGAQLIAEKLLKDYYGIGDPDTFLKATEELVHKYKDLMIESHKMKLLQTVQLQ